MLCFWLCDFLCVRNRKDKASYKKTCWPVVDWCSFCANVRLHTNLETWRLTYGCDMCCSAASDGRAAAGPDHSSGPHRDFPLWHQRKPSTGRLLAKRRKSGMQSFCRPFLNLILSVGKSLWLFWNFGQTNISRRRHGNWIKDYTEQIPTNSIELRRTEGVINASESDQVEHKDSPALVGCQACRIQALNGFDFQNFLLTESYMSAFNSTVKGWNNWGQSGASPVFRPLRGHETQNFLVKKKRNKMEVVLLNPAATSAVLQHNKEDLLRNVSTKESLK